ncbi:MAG: 1,4-alpha-glucan branching enzyme [Solirubrobacterales bacterium]|jgi:1,4-alpha-glucan branching enzyme|nr:1,4-alpha-glucan branching enzyme [Solirubrobacterales bacterium]
MPRLNRPDGTGGGAEDAGGSGSKGDLAIVLHSHMPYVEGFGTYPFGEEWLFDAVVRSYLPVLEVAERMTVTVTPVLADQLEAPGVAERLVAFVDELRASTCEADGAEMPANLGEAAFEDACLSEAKRYRDALARLEALGGDPLQAFCEPATAGRIELAASSATHAVLPLLATLAGRRVQIDAGLRSHARRFGKAAGFWLPECAYEPGLERLLAERGLQWFVSDQSEHGAPLDALAPVATAAGPVAFTIDWEAVSWLWSLQGYPSDQAHRDFHRQSLRGARPWSIGGGVYDPAAADAAAARQANEFLAAIAERLERFAAERGRRGLVVFAIDTELLGHWWWEGPQWLREVVLRAEGHGVELVTLSQARARHVPEERPLLASTWGEEKDLRTWDSPEVADLAWAARRLELRLLRALGDGLVDGAAERAVRELLALQASDWAFLDRRRQAGDYPFQRATDHAQAMLEAIHSVDPPEGSLRNLAPDLSLSPLLEP